MSRCIHPSTKKGILRTNRQIYEEAYGILYSELTIQADLYNLVDKESDGDSNTAAMQKVWRHHPMSGIGHTSSNRNGVYNTAKLSESMEPHVFARFSKIELTAVLTLIDQEDAPPVYFDYYDLRLKAEDEANVISYLGTMTVIRQLTALLSRSPQINQLVMLLGLQVREESTGARPFDDAGSAL